jgi:hypothetical protein
MEDGIARLMLRLLEWLDERPRTYAQAIDAWRSSCPRHPVWDDALLAGLIRIEQDRATGEQHAVLTPQGKAMLEINSDTRRTWQGERGDSQA